jgi:integrase
MGLSGIRFHDLRHTAAALMLNNGVDVFVASKRLGHAKPSITLDVYGHLLSSAQNEVADKMDRLLSIKITRSIPIYNRYKQITRKTARLSPNNR